MSMIPRQVKPERDELTIRLDRDASETLAQYMQFIASPRDYVIGHALRLVFAKDRAFTVWRAAQGITPPTATGVRTGTDGRHAARSPRRRARLPGAVSPGPALEAAVRKEGTPHAIDR